MSKYTTIEVWDALYPGITKFYDYAGRKVKKSACGNEKSNYFPTIEHIRPLDDGGKDIFGNMVISHRTTNEEKGNSFPTWKANGSLFQAKKIKGCRDCYEIVEIIF